ncbi:Chorion peroxidase [Halotydeus destructor]|nr:Chorion peroxidase [Halotydeus destructor]
MKTTGVRWMQLNFILTFAFSTLFVESKKQPSDCALQIEPAPHVLNIFQRRPLVASRLLSNGRLCVTYRDVNQIVREATESLGNFVPRENKELSSNYPKPPHIAVVAAILEEATRLLGQSFGLTREQILYDLRAMDISGTLVEDICPTFLKPVRCDVSKYRTISGMCNNLIKPSRASSRSAMVRYIPPAYEDNISQPRQFSVTGAKLPNPRTISSAIHDDENRADGSVTVMLATWGQVVVHDINFGSPTLDEKGNPIHCCSQPEKDWHPACYPFPISSEDYFYKHFNRSCMNFVRLTPGLRPKCPLGPREPMNIVSGYLDGSIMYGSSSDIVNPLRSGERGRLKSYKAYSELGLKDLLPQQTHKPDFLCQRHNRPKDVFCFLGGDIRSNQQLPLTLLHTLLMREHNRIAEFLYEMVPQLDDDTLFEETRRLVIAQIQYITYREFLPVVVGDQLMDKYDLHILETGFYHGYDEKVNAEVRVAFQAAAFRFGHSLVPDVIQTYNKHHQKLSSIRTSNILRQPFELYKPAVVDTFILGLLNQPASRMDPTVTIELVNHLFEKPGNHFGADLAAINIQRARELGVPGYNEFRQYCGVDRAETFSDLLGTMSNKTVTRLENVYDHVDDIDLWTAGVAEFPLPGALVGPVFGCLIAEQFANLRKGDRFWFENANWPSSFTSKQLAEIRKTSLARLVCDNADDIDTIQVFPLTTVDWESNPRVSCSQLPGIDLKEFFGDQIMNVQVSS